MTPEELVRRRLELFNERRLDRLDEVLADDVVMHFAGAGGEQTVEGLVALRELFASFDALDVKGSIDTCITEGDRVAVRYTVEGAHERDFMGVEAVGAKVKFTAAAIHRVDDGKIVETWNVDDMYAMMRQIGVISSPAGEEH